MKDHEKAIKDAANNFATRDGHFTINPLNEAGIRATTKGFEAGAKSPEAKELHQQGMYSEEEVLNFAVYCGTNFVSYQSQRDGKRIWFDPKNVKYFTTEMLLKNWERDKDPTIEFVCPIGAYEPDIKIADCVGSDSCRDLCKTCTNYEK